MKKRHFTIKFAAFFLMTGFMILGLSGCKKKQEAQEESSGYLSAYEEYVKSVLDANFHGEYADYIEITGATKEQAKSMHESHAVSLAEELAETYAIELKQLPAEIGDQLTDICEKVYQKTEYEVSDAEQRGGSVEVTVTVRPVDFLEKSLSATSKYTDEFNDRAKSGEFENMSESQYENEYAEGILKVLESELPKIGYKNKVTYSVTIRYDAQTGVNYLADEDLDAINRKVLGE